MGRKTVRPAARATRPALPAAAAWLAERAGVLSLLGILLLALLVRLAALDSFQESLYGRSLLWDERAYHEWARRIADGTFDSGRPYRAAPLPAYVMAAVYALTGAGSDAVRLLHVLLGTGTCALAYRLGRELCGIRTGLLAALGVALYKPLILASIVPLKTALAVFLFAAVACLALSGLRTLRGIPLGGLGLATGLLLNVQGNAVALIPASLLCLGLELLLRGRAESPGAARPPLGRAALLLGAYLLGLGLGTAPFALRNYRAAGAFVLTTPQSGFALYAGNRLANPDPYFRPVPFASPDPSEQLTQMTIEASRRTGRPLGTASASAFWRQATLREMVERPGLAVEKLVRKGLAVVNRSETCDHYHVGFLSRFVPALRLPFLAFWVVFPLGMAGAVIAARRSRQAVWLLTLVGAYAGSLVLFYPGARFRLPLLAVWIPLAAVGIETALAAWRTRRARPLLLPAAALAAAAILQGLPLRGASDLAAFHNTHAIVLYDRGRTEEAVNSWREAAALQQPYSAFAHLALAGLSLGAGNAEAALGHLARIPDDSFAAAFTHDLRGDAQAVRGRWRQAAAEYDRALALNAGLRETREKLIRMLERVAPERVETERERLRWIAAFYERP